MAIRKLPSVMTTQICSPGGPLQLSKSHPPILGGIDHSVTKSVPLLAAGSAGLVFALVDTISTAGDTSETCLSGLSALGSRAEPESMS